MRRLATSIAIGLVVMASGGAATAQNNSSDGTDVLQVYLQVQQLEQKVRRMRGEIESLKYQLAQNKKAQQKLYQDLRQRLESGSADGGSTTANSGSSRSSGPSSKNTGSSSTASGSKSGTSSAVRDQYMAAFNQLKNGHYTKATASFKEFTQAHPDSGLTDNAYYWMGEGYYVQQQYSPAKSAFQNVVNKFSESPKVPDSLYKIALIQIRTGQKDNARATLNRVVDQYGDSDVAKKARSKLDALGG